MKKVLLVIFYTIALAVVLVFGAHGGRYLISMDSDVGVIFGGLAWLVTLLGGIFFISKLIKYALSE